MNKEQQQELNKKLADAADNGNLSEVASLIEAGADVNGKHCLDGCQHTPLMKAAMKGHLAIITYLLERGANPAIIASEKKTAIDMARENNKPDSIARIEAFEYERKPDRVSFHCFVGDRLREDIFDFTMKERLTLIRQSRFGAVEAATITGFSAIEDQSDGSLLRKAFNEHVKRGGETPEADVFTARLYKPKPGLQKG